MKKKTITCSITIVVIASVVLFAGCFEPTPAPKPTPPVEQPESTPTTSSTGNEYLLHGTLCYAKSSSGISSSYYRTEWLTFDGQGRFTYDYESTYSSDADILYDEGDAESGTYKVVGDNIHMTFSDETSVVATVYFRQDDGRITEIYCGDRLYATSLC